MRILSRTASHRNLATVTFLQARILIATCVNHSRDIRQACLARPYVRNRVAYFGLCITMLQILRGNLSKRDNCQSIDVKSLAHLLPLASCHRTCARATGLSIAQ